MLQIGSLVDGKYKILSKIGSGGMSVVYMAINEKANKTWAVKELRREGVVNYEAVRNGLIAETEILKKLHHPHLPSIVDVIEDQDSLLIVMDYVEGVSLNVNLEEYGAQPQELVIEWGKQLCDVLAYLHSRNHPLFTAT
jgi:serine/threonine protein kinase